MRRIGLGLFASTTLALSACGSPIPDNFPPLEGGVSQNITFELDGVAYQCREGETAQSGSAGIDFFTVCEDGGIRVVLGSTDTIGEKDIECGTDNTFEISFDSGSSTDCVNGKIVVDGFEGGYAWGKMWGEHPSGTISDGMYSIKHEDRGHAVVD